MTKYIISAIFPPIKEGGTVLTTNKPIVDFYEAWGFLEEHRIFDLDGVSMFAECLSIAVVKVNPSTLVVEDDSSRNTKTQVWLECGPWNKPEELDEHSRPHFPQGVASHNIDLDCGADTFEEAVIKLANLVARNYPD